MRRFAALLMACAGFATVSIPPAVAQPAPSPLPVPETFTGTPAVMFGNDPTIVNLVPMTPQAWSRTTDERMVMLHFTTGTPECYGVNATVYETTDDVVVDLRSGTLPQAVDRACIMIALFGAVDVALQNPLGARRVLSVL